MRSSIRIGLGSILLVAACMLAASLTFAPAGAETSTPDIQDAIPSRFVDQHCLYLMTLPRDEAVLAHRKKREVVAELIADR